MCVRVSPVTFIRNYDCPGEVIEKESGAKSVGNAEREGVARTRVENFSAWSVMLKRDKQRYSVAARDTKMEWK